MNGAIIYNDNGIVQISDGLAGYGMAAKGTISIPGNNAGANLTLPISASTNYALFVKNLGTGFLTVEQQNSTIYSSRARQEYGHGDVSGRNKLRFLNFSNSQPSSGSASFTASTAEWALFTQSGGVPASHGIKILNESGGEVYNSGYATTSVRSAFTITNATIAPVTVGHQLGSRPWVLANPMMAHPIPHDAHIYPRPAISYATSGQIRVRWLSGRALPGSTTWPLGNNPNPSVWLPTCSFLMSKGDSY